MTLRKVFGIKQTPINHYKPWNLSYKHTHYFIKLQIMPISYDISFKSHKSKDLKYVEYLNKKTNSCNPWACNVPFWQNTCWWIVLTRFLRPNCFYVLNKSTTTLPGSWLIYEPFNKIYLFPPTWVIYSKKSPMHYSYDNIFLQKSQIFSLSNLNKWIWGHHFTDCFN